MELTNGERVSVDVLPSDPAATGRGGGAKEEGEEGEDEEYKAKVKRKEQEVESAQRGTVVISASEIGATSL